jgi:threonine aldolase
MHVHIDAARVFLALAATKEDPKDLMKYCDSLAFCLGKGMLAPMASMVVGSKAFMESFKENRKLMGGVLRKPGVIAGTGLIALKKMRFELGKDIEMAKLLAEKIKDLDWLKIVCRVETNMVYYEVTDESLDLAALQEFLFKHKVFCSVHSGMNRFTVHHYIREAEIDKLVELLKAFK